MTLSLEQVRQTRFHLARRNGYEPMDVDNFVDKVEVTLQQLGEENGRECCGWLKRLKGRVSFGEALN